ncbi:MAG TPA: type II secretion system protein GspC [Gammaproteobacteria bacterium]
MIDVARTLTLLKERSPEHWVRAVNRFGPPIVTAALVLVIARQLAALTWTVVPHHTFDRPAPVIVQPAAGAEEISAARFAALEGAHLFGEAPAEAPAAPIPAEVEAPDTTLSIRLTGVIAGGEGGGGYAIIASGRDQEKKYGIGQAIDGTNGATLQAVYGDRVILSRGGRLETLRLPKETPTTGTGPAAARLATPRPAAEEDASLRTVLSDNASRLTDIMRMAPHVEGGQMVGFRINPGRDRETFEALGLMPGDIVTDINGIVLDDPSRALQVFEALGESTQANITVLRDGVPNVMVIDTTQLQSLAQDRQ